MSPSLADALRMLRDQARRTPAPQWVRVVGGWSEFQFAERRHADPGRDQRGRARHAGLRPAPVRTARCSTRAALRAVGYTKDTPDPIGGTIERDTRGQPDRNAHRQARMRSILYATLAKGPKLPDRVSTQFDAALHARAQPPRASRA